MHGCDKVADGAVGFQLVTELGAVQHAVAIATALALALDHTAGLQFGEDFHDGALGDPHLLGEVADAQRIIGGETEQDVGMVRQKRP